MQVVERALDESGWTQLTVRLAASRAKEPRGLRRATHEGIDWLMGPCTW